MPCWGLWKKCDINMINEQTDSNMPELQKRNHKMSASGSRPGDIIDETHSNSSTCNIHTCSYSRRVG